MLVGEQRIGRCIPTLKELRCTKDLCISKSQHPQSINQLEETIEKELKVGMYVLVSILQSSAAK